MKPKGKIRKGRKKYREKFVFQGIKKERKEDNRKGICILRRKNSRNRVLPRRRTVQEIVEKEKEQISGKEGKKIQGKKKEEI